MKPDAARVLVMTGASSAIGQALIARLEPDWRVVAIGRGKPSGGGADGQITWLPADLRGPLDPVLTAVEARIAAWGAAPVLGFVHLAGVVFSDRTEQTTGFEWDTTLAVNLSAAFFLARSLKPLFAPAASVVMVSSIDARQASRHGPAAAYGAAKAGLEGLTRHLAVEWGPDGVRVNAVAPGALAAGNGPGEPAVAAEFARRCPLGRLGTPGDVADVIRFLLDSRSGYVTGAVIPVDGGAGLAY